MKRNLLPVLLVFSLGVFDVGAQERPPREFGGAPSGLGGPPGFGPGGPGGPGMNAPDLKLVDMFDKDDNGWLNDEERAEARSYLASDESPRRNLEGRRPGPGGPGQSSGADAQVGPGRPNGPGGPDRPNRPGGLGPADGRGFRPPQDFGPSQEFGPPQEFGPRQDSGPPSEAPGFGQPPREPRGPGFGPPPNRPEVEGPSNSGGPGAPGEPSRPRPRRSGGPGGAGGPGGPGGGPDGRGRLGGPGGRFEPTSPGRAISPADVQTLEGEFYDPTVLRTIFINFTNSDWEEELEIFHGTDVDVPATVIVDGQNYSNVGIRFRGASSYMMVPRGSKRSFNLTVDMADDSQRIHGYKTLNLLNQNADPSLMSTVLYSHVANQYIPAPKANFVRVVVNGESWGVYTNVQQYNKEFLSEHFESTKGARWKVSGRPNGRGGLEYLGPDKEAYYQHYDMKTDTPEAWEHLINLCRVLEETPTEELKAALEPILDIDQVLWFLALDNALINNDGYWVRASDYSLFMDENNKFHIFPHDMNESFQPPMNGPGGRGPGGRGPGGPGGPVGRDVRSEGRPLEEGQFGEGRALENESGPESGDDRPGDRRPRPEERRPGGGQLGEGRPGDDGRGEPRRGEQGPEIGGRRAGPGRQEEFGQRGPGGPNRFRGPGEPGGSGGPGVPGGGQPNLDPLTGINNPRTPLYSRMLAVPELREKYLENVRTIAQESLTWEKLGPFVTSLREMLEPEVKLDTRKLTSYEAFMAATDPEGSVTNSPPDENEAAPRPVPPSRNLRMFIEQRRQFLLK